MTTKAQALTILTLGATLVIASAQTTQTAAAAAAPPPPALSSTEQTIKDIKNPATWMTWGADLRVRDEYFNNLLTLNPERRCTNRMSSAYARVSGPVSRRSKTSA